MNRKDYLLAMMPEADIDKTTRQLIVLLSQTLGLSPGACAVCGRHALELHVVDARRVTQQHLQEIALSLDMSKAVLTQYKLVVCRLCRPTLCRMGAQRFQSSGDVDADLMLSTSERRRERSNHLRSLMYSIHKEARDLAGSHEEICISGLRRIFMEQPSSAALKCPCCMRTYKMSSMKLRTFRIVDMSSLLQYDGASLLGFCSILFVDNLLNVQEWGVISERVTGLVPVCFACFNRLSVIGAKALNP